MKRYSRYLCLALALVLTFAVSVNAESNFTEITPYSSSFFRSYGSYLSRSAGTLFYVCFEVSAKAYMAELGVSAVEVQRSSDGNSWTTVKTFLPENYPSMIADNTFAHAGSLLYAGSTGYYYRAHITFYAKNSSGSGKLYMYTETLRI